MSRGLKSTTPCNHGNACNKKGCPYLHPARSSRVKAPHHTRIDVSNTPCRLTSSCPSLFTTTHQVCPFKHKAEWSTSCRHGNKCSGTNWGCAYNHIIPCRHGLDCYNPDCTYTHPRLGGSKHRGGY